ncbi:MAG: terminase large subunit [Bradyrhizobium sp.]|uniref:terminase large subunit n=1 Tax=Bradyrhizobium sp. TaxID=376 RepID=UPI003D10B82F
MADRLWDLSCPDWQDRIRRGHSLVPDLPLFEDEARDGVAFFNALRLPDVPGMPLLKDAAGDWYRDIVRAVFGARDPETNVRHLQGVFALIGKGNSKTTYSAGLMLTALLMNVRPRAEFLFVAPTQAIADIAFNSAWGMIEADPELLKRFHVRDDRKDIRDRTNQSHLRIKTFDLNILTGPKPVGVLLDELHLLGKSPHTTKVLRQIRGGLEKNSEGFLIIITTQSDEPPAGAFRDELIMARKTRDGEFRGRMLPILYEFPPNIASDQEQWQRPENWHLVMPNLGRSLRLESLVQDWETEREKGEHAIRIWASQHLNIELGIGLHTDRWAGADFWEGRATVISLEDLIERCDVVVVGIDGGGLDDLLGFAALGREKKSRRWLHWGKAWAHRCVLERRKEIASRLLDFEASGDLMLIDDDSDADVQGVADLVEQIAEAGLLPGEKAIGVDPVGINDIVDELERRGFDADPDTGRITAIRQGWTLSNTIKTAERRLAAGDLIHAGQPLMSFAVGNAKVVPRGNAISITKQAAGSAKIDPLMALFNAVALMVLNPEGAGAITEDYEMPVWG